MALWRICIYYNVHPVWARGRINYNVAGKETCYFTCHFSWKTCEGKKPESECTASVTMTPTISSHESSCLAHYNVHVSVHCRLFLFSLSKKLTFTRVASAMTAVHIDCLILTSNTPRPEIQPLVSLGSNHFHWPPVMDGQITIILYIWWRHNYIHVYTTIDIVWCRKGLTLFPSSKCILAGQPKDCFTSQQDSDIHC